MTTFDEREKAFEAKFTHDQETRFKVRVRRNRLLAQWASGKMGLAGAAVDAYAKEVVEADFQVPGDDDVVAKVTADLNAKGIKISTEDVRAEMDRLMADAKKQLAAEVR